MNRKQFAHTIRAAGGVLGVDELLIIGSQAIHASVEQPPPAANRSIETDIAVFADDPEAAADLIDASIGEASMFQQSHGYYAQGVEPTTAILPEGWRKRLIPFQDEDTGGVKAMCLEIHDLWVSKAMASRPKDKEFCRELLVCGFVDPDLLRERIDLVENQPDEKLDLARRWTLN